MRLARAVTLGLLVATTAIAVGCSEDSTTAGPASHDPLVAQLVSLGFRGDMIQDRGDYFLVEGDIEILKSSIPDLVANPPVDIAAVVAGHDKATPGARPLFQWRTNVTVAGATINNIKVNLSGLATVPAWQSAARQALTEWNNVTCGNIRLVEGSPANITFSTYTDSPDKLASAAYPSGNPGVPGSTVRVNTNYNGIPDNDLTKLYAMVHEIGHTIGFRHTDWKDRGELEGSAGANLIAGTPPTDPASVMNGATGGLSWAGFSANDQLAASILYPSCPKPNLTGPSQVSPYFSCTWTSTPAGGTPPYQYSWLGGPLSGSRTYSTSRSSDFTMRVAVVDAVGRRIEQSMPVRVYPYGPACG